MKKVFISILLCSISIVCLAQTDVTKFLGIPVDGSKAEMMRKIKAKGFTQSPYAQDVLTGVFNGMDVTVHIGTNKGKVCRIMVCDDNAKSEIDIKNRFNILCEQFKTNPRYWSFSEGDQKIQENEDISYEMTAHNKRYEAIFYQIPDITSANHQKEIQALLSSKYSQEQLNNPSEEVAADIKQIAGTYAIEIALKKPVWFYIQNNYGQYYIYMFYDNEYNRAHGEDL